MALSLRPISGADVHRIHEWSIGMSYEGTLGHTMLIRDGWRDSQMRSVLTHERWPSPAGLRSVTQDPI